ncbi:Uncharacterised protein [Legionella beliardensis]|uniref:Uncharacterized protein n=1 Tax=Legionella beliardensis TaxID=91822 RepID=A0A378HYV7_9GAMM|nr:hypothetical protein [Legionella beliardensis]STX27903.1 Uncharacterised protein [Legionella beliardensis]
MKKLKGKLDREEKELLEPIEQGEWKTVDNLEEEIAKPKSLLRIIYVRMSV